jgi:anti-sigma regulatory factor (Ser/Thr protein kinase)
LTIPSLRRTLHNYTDDLVRCSEVFQDFLAEYSLSAGAMFRVDLVLEEIVTNVVKYGYEEGREPSVEVGLIILENTVRLEFEDAGREFNPLHAPEPPDPTQPEDIPIGGRGLQLLRGIIQSGEYRRESGHNRLILHISRHT